MLNIYRLQELADIVGNTLMFVRQSKAGLFRPAKAKSVALLHATDVKLKN